MSNLIPCRECGHEVAKTAVTCPGCGAAEPAVSASDLDKRAKSQRIETAKARLLKRLNWDWRVTAIGYWLLAGFLFLVVALPWLLTLVADWGATFVLVLSMACFGLLVAYYKWLKSERERIKSKACRDIEYKEEFGDQGWLVASLEDRLAEQERKLGRAHPDTLECMADLAQTYDVVGRYADALKLHKEVLALRKSKLGPDHSNTLQAMVAVAATLAKVNRGTEAVSMIDECVRRAERQALHPAFVARTLDVRLRYFEKLGDSDGCRTTAAIWDDLNHIDADSLYTAACFHAITATVNHTAPRSTDAQTHTATEMDQAMVRLSQAVAAGYGETAGLETNKDFTVLRDRDDFKELLAELKGRKQSGNNVP